MSQPSKSSPTIPPRLIAGISAALLANSALAQTYPLPARGRLTPLSVIPIRRLPDNRLIPTGNWLPIPDPPDGSTIPIFDAFESDSLGTPTGFCTSGCNQFGWCPSSPPSYRWWNANYRAPFSTNDMIIAPAFAGAHAIRTQFAWWWAHPQPTHCYVAILTGIDFHDCPSGLPPTSGELGGTVFDYGPIVGEGGYWYSDIDLRGTGISWIMPPTGSGTYTIMLGTDYNAATGVFTLDPTWGTQPMQWGTGDAETPNDGRPGSQTQMQWDDWRNANGILEWNECSNYSDSHHCPNPAGSMLAFFIAAATPCYVNCDGSTSTPILTANDFQCFLNQFASGNAAANCDGSTIAPTLTANDFQCFLNRYASGCS